MQVKVLFFGVLKDVIGHAEEWVEIRPNSTISDLFQLFVQRHATLEQRRPSILFAKNREFAPAAAVLAENDEIAFLPPVSGGSDHVLQDPAGHFFAITRRTIDSRALAADLQRGEDGAVVVFEGIVRNNTKGRLTKYLEYECYETMALAHMARIGRELAAALPIGHIGVIHRLGRLQVGEASVVVIATAPHRKPAFEAALECINRLKREVPIWKKEFFSDGEVWVEGEWDERLLTPAASHDSV
jgi:molybdopterin synthase catalytic subunit